MRNTVSCFESNLPVDRHRQGHIRSPAERIRERDHGYNSKTHSSMPIVLAFVSHHFRAQFTFEFLAKIIGRDRSEERRVGKEC